MCVCVCVCVCITLHFYECVLADDETNLMKKVTHASPVTIVSETSSCLSEIITYLSFDG